MPKVKISEYSATANSNTDVASINIDEGCAPSGINNAIRAVMGHLKDFQQGTNGDPFNGPVNGTLGATTASTANVTTLTTSSTVTHNGGTANGVAYLNANKVLTTGSALVFDGTSLGVGVTPSVQYSGIKSFQIGSTTNLFDNGASTKFYHNAYTAASGNETYLTTGYAQGYLMASNGQHQWYTAASGTAGNAITFTQAMTLDASSRLLIGLTSSLNANGTIQAGGFSDTRVVIDGSSTQGIFFTKSGADNGTYRVDASGNYNWFVKGAATANMTLDASGNLLVGTTTQTATFNATYTGTSQGVSYNYASNASFTQAIVHAAMAGSSSSAQLFLGRNNNTTAVFYVNGTGAIYSTSIVITAISDQRLKENVRDIDTGLAAIMALKPRRFDWKEGKGQNKKDAAGFVAQEFKTVFPKSVSTGLVDSDGTEYLTMNHEELIPTLVKAMQEQQALITTLTARITALESA